MTETLFAKYATQIYQDGYSICSRKGDRYITTMAAKIDVYLLVGLSDQTYVHGGLVLKGSFYLSWLDETFKVVVFHRMPSGLRIVGTQNLTEAGNVLRNYGGHCKAFHLGKTWGTVELLMQFRRFIADDLNRQDVMVLEQLRYAEE